MKKTIEKIEELKKCFIEEITELLEKQPGKMINTENRNLECDNINLYYIDVNGDTAEVQMLGIRIGKYGNIEVAFKYEYMDTEDTDDIPENIWYNLFGGEILGFSSLMEISESIEEYLQNK